MPFSRAFAQQFFAGQAFAVIAHLDQDGAALVAGREGDGALFGFALGAPFFGQLQAVIAAVADQVGQGVGDFFHQSLVELGGFTVGDELHLFAQLAGQVAQHARETVEHHRHGDHADGHHRFLQVAGVAVEIGQARQQGLVHRGVEFAAFLGQHGLGDHEFAHQVDELVDLADRHPQGARFHRLRQLR